MTLPRNSGHPLKDVEPALQEFRALAIAQANPHSPLWNEPVRQIHSALLGIGGRIFQSQRFRGLGCDPEHAVQETLQRFLEYGIGRCQPGRPLYPYVYQIHVRICLTMGRRARRRRMSTLNIDRGEDRTNPARLVERKHTRIATRLAIRKLGPDDRNLVSDRFYRGLTAREMGAKRGLSTGQIDRRMSAIYCTLRNDPSLHARGQAP